MLNDAQETASQTPHIRQAGASDLEPLVAMMDGIMEWLVAQGRTAQWGSTPWSAVQARIDSLAGRIARGEMRVAVDEDGWVAGAMSASETPNHYIQPADEPELFINFLSTSRHHKGRNVGGALLDEARAQARRQGLGLLRVDCFAGDDGRLKRWYTSQGFTEVEPFTVPRENGPDWPGMLLAERLA